MESALRSPFSVREDTTLALELAVDGARHANVQSLHAAGQRAAVCCFCDQMQMVALHGEVYQAEAKALLPAGKHLLHARKELSARRAVGSSW